NEPVSVLVLRLIEPQGTVADISGATWTDAGLVVPLARSLARGSHMLIWRVVSLDGHPIGGTLMFSVISPGAEGIRAREAMAPGLRPAIWAFRFLLFLGLTVAVGTAAFRAWHGLAATPGSAAVNTGAAITMIAAACSIGLLGLDAIAEPWHALAAP